MKTPRERRSGVISERRKKTKPKLSPIDYAERLPGRGRANAVSEGEGVRNSDCKLSTPSPPPSPQRGEGEDRCAPRGRNDFSSPCKQGEGIGGPVAAVLKQERDAPHCCGSIPVHAA